MNQSRTKVQKQTNLAPVWAKSLAWLMLAALTPIQTFATVNTKTLISAPASAQVAITGTLRFCAGGSTQLTANVSGISGTPSFTWRRNGVFMPGATTATITVDNPGLYTVTASGGGQSATSEAVQVRVFRLKTLVQNACPGSTGNVNLVLLDNLGSANQVTYSWSTGFNGQDLMGVPSGLYSVTATDVNGCAATASALVNNTIVNVDAGQNVSICAGGSVQLNATGADNYKWAPAAGLSSDFIANPMASPTTTTTYTLTGYVNSGDLVTNGDFNQRNTGFYSDYAYVNSFASGGYSTGTGLYPEGKYAVVPNRSDTNVTRFHPAFRGVGRNRGMAAGENDDFYMAINGSSTQGQIVWQQTVEVLPNTSYNFSTWIASINLGNLSRLRFKINNDVLGDQIVAPNALNTWNQFFTTWNSGSNTTATISIINDNLILSGNDFGLDDISFSVSCMATDQVTVTVLPALGGNTLSCPQQNVFCLSGDPGMISGSLPTGGNGLYTFQWQISDDNSGFSDIVGATDQNYNPGPVNASTWYRRIVRSGDCSNISASCGIQISGQNGVSNNTITAPQQVSFCGSGNPAMINGSSPSGQGQGDFTFIWESSTDGNNWDLIQNANNASYDPGVLTQTTSFRRIARKGNCLSGTSNVITITINNAPVVNIPAASARCGAGLLSLEANATGTVRWFAAPQGGQALFTGQVYTVNVAQTTPYYVEASSNGCTSARTEVLAQVNQAPSIVSTTPGFICGAGNASVSASASAGSVNWYFDAAGAEFIGSGSSVEVPVSGSTVVYVGASQNGCASDLTSVAITVGQNSNSSVAETACDSYTWALNGETYTTSGQYTHSSLNESGCEHITTLNLTINASGSESISATIEEGQSYPFFGSSLTTGGIYTNTGIGANGCPFVTTLTLTVVPSDPNPSTCSAVEYMDFIQGPSSDLLTPVAAARSNPMEALGTPENSDAVTSPENNNFVSLGFGGSIVLKFAYPIKNGPGDDIFVVETTFNSASANRCSRYPERIRVFASQDNCNWVYLGENCQDTYFDLKGLNWAQYVKLVDVSDPTAFNGLVDGYDLDGILCLHGEETNPTATELVFGSAQEIINYTPGLRKNGTPIVANRRVPANALGMPQNTDVVNFVSLGFGGSLTVKFDYVIFDAPGADLSLVETSFGNPSCNSYPERAQVEGSLDGEKWVVLNENICLDGSIDVAAAGAIQFIRVTDRSMATQFGGSADGYDVDGFVVLHSCASAPARLADPNADNVSVANEVISSTAYPNPFDTDVQLSMNTGDQDDVVVIRVMNNLGQVVMTKRLNVAPSSEIVETLSLQGLRSGIYMLNVETKNAVETIKLVKK